MDNITIGKTKLESADAPMGVVFGKIIEDNGQIDYDFIKLYCQNNEIELAFDHQEDKLICTRTIVQLQVFSPAAIEIKGVGNQITGMDGDGYEIIIEGIGYPFYGEEFPQHREAYRKMQE
ncbi:MAG: hypothetical protein WBA17_03845 [Saprospiraceae bacterium]